MAIDTDKDLVRRFYADAINARDLSAVDRLLAEDFTHNGEQRGREGQRPAVEAFLAGFSDLHNEILVLFGEEGLVAAHQRWTGTHDGPFAGIEPTGKRVDFTSTAILRIEGELIAEAWDEVDMLTLMGQIGGN